MAYLPTFGWFLMVTYGRCRLIYHTWMVWVVRSMSVICCFPTFNISYQISPLHVGIYICQSLLRLYMRFYCTKESQFLSRMSWEPQTLDAIFPPKKRGSMGKSILKVSKKITTHPWSTPQAIPLANYERNPFVACW